MTDKKPEPLYVTKERQRCPVCGQISYSHTGIHPQCAVKQQDLKQKENIKLKKEAEESKGPKADAGERWQRNCPKCNASQHVRKKVCSCGHVLKSTTNSPLSEEI